MYKQILPVPTCFFSAMAATATASKTCLKAMMLFIILSMTVVPSITLADKKNTHGFSATLEHRFQPLQQTLMRSDVIVSEHGYRVQSRDAGLGQSLIANMATGNIWFVDQERSMVHELPMTRVADAPEFPIPMVRLPGFIDSVPCFGQDGNLADDVIFNEIKLQRWRCSASDNVENSNELPVEQYYSEELSLVMYSRSANGLESHLLNIDKHTIDSKLFVFPEGLRSVGIEEFLGVKPAIGIYPDAAR